VQLAALERELLLLTLELSDEVCSLSAPTARAEEVDPVVQLRSASREGALLLPQLRELTPAVSRFGVHATTIGSSEPFC